MFTENLIRKSTHHFTLNLHEPLPPVRGNRQQLEQVIINLITNACQALDNTESPIIITSACQPRDRTVSVDIRDAGIGIDPAQLPHVKDPFFTSKSESGGTGLGLPIAQRVIEAHNGFIRVVSELGKGSTFSVVLPKTEVK